MAKVRNNVMVRGLSGSFGDQMVIKTDKGGRTIVSNKPGFNENRRFSDVQLSHQESFRRASAYAKDAKGREEYAALAQGTPKSGYNVAMADWFNAPEILELDVTGYHGQPGNIIRVMARDDVKVTGVSVVITDNQGVVQEQGQATQVDGEWWNYMATTTAPDGPRVVATAHDMPGHTGEMSWQD